MKIVKLFMPFIAALSITFYLIFRVGALSRSAMADNTDTSTAAAAVSTPVREKSPAPEVVRPIRTDGIDQAGEKVSKGLDQIEQWCSQRIGLWVIKTTFAGITWLTLELLKGTAAQFQQPL